MGALDSTTRPTRLVSKTLGISEHLAEPVEDLKFGSVCGRQVPGGPCRMQKRDGGDADLVVGGAV
jgi:hypothetical protein